MKKTMACAAVLFALFGASANAELLAEWSVDGLTGGFAANPIWTNTTVATGMDSVSAIAKLDETKTNSSYYGDTQMTFKLQNNTTINLDRYVQVFVVPETGQEMSLSNFSFNVWSTSSGAQNAAVRSSLDGFSSDLASFAINRSANNRSLVDLSGGGEFVHLNSSLEFRISLWNAQGLQTAYFTDGTGTNAIAVDGTVSAIPEPATLGMLGVAVAGLLFVRKRFLI